MKKVLLSMGYRQIKKDVYGKPVAMNLFMFEINTLIWTNWFVGRNKQQLIWESNLYEPDETVENDFIKFLKHTEAYTRISDKESQYEFLSLTEMIDL